MVIFDPSFFRLISTTEARYAFLQLGSLAGKFESRAHSLQQVTIQQSKGQYRSLEALSAKLSEAAGSLPVEIEALKEHATAW
jgi:hypothetical protein